MICEYAEGLVKHNIEHNPDKLDEELELMIKGTQFRKELLDFLANELNEVAKEFNDAKFKYIIDPDFDQYCISLAEIYCFANDHAKKLEKYFKFSVMVANEIKKYEPTAVSEAAEQLMSFKKGDIK